MPSPDLPLRLREVVAAQVRKRRAAAGLSQEELAYRAGLHRTYISQVERAEKSPTIDSLDKLAEALGVEPAELLAPLNLDAEALSRAKAHRGR